MRTIKFRGKMRSYFTGKDVAIICSQSIRQNGDKFFMVLDGAWHRVHDVAQLIAIDKHGHEIYEGYLVEDLEFNRLLPPTEATFCHYAKILSGEIVLAEVQS